MWVHCRVNFDLFFSQRLFLKCLLLFWFILWLFSAVADSYSQQENPVAQEVDNNNLEDDVRSYICDHAFGKFYSEVLSKSKGLSLQKSERSNNSNNYKRTK